MTHHQANKAMSDVCIGSAELPHMFQELQQPFTGELLFDRLPDIVYFVKSSDGCYQVVNNTLVERAGMQRKEELIGRTAGDVLGESLGKEFLKQDRQVLDSGVPLLNQLELHMYPSGKPGWCLTNKLPLPGKDGAIVGLVGVSQDLRMPDLTASEYERLSAAIEYVQANISQFPKLNEVASAGAMSPFQLDRCIQRVFGLTAGQWLLKLRIETAEQQLSSTDLPIVMIALNAGYSDQSTFSRQFRKTVGMSPSKYRAEVKRIQNTEPHETS